MSNDLSVAATSGLHLLFALTGRDMMPLFWILLLLELPRHVVGALVLLCHPHKRGAVSRSSRGAARHFSVVIVGHNEAKALPKCLRSIWEQTAMRDAGGARRGEIIVVDDGSTDATQLVVTELRRSGLIDVGLSLQLRGGKSAAANLALAHCRSDFIVVVDADTSFDRDAFERLLAEFDDPLVGAVSGNLFVRNSGASLTAVSQDIEYRIGVSLGRGMSAALGVLGIVSGAFGAFRREALLQVGDFDVEVGEDADLSMKLRQAGWRIAFAPHAYAGTDVPESAWSLVRQRLRWERSAVTIWLRKYRHLLNPFCAGFDLANALVILDVALVQIALGGAFFLYMGWLVASLGWVALVIVSATLIVYTAVTAVLLLIAALAGGRGGVLRLLPYLPYFVVFHCLVMRAVRLYAAVDELAFRSSYRDPYVPRRVMKEIERW